MTSSPPRGPRLPADPGWGFAAAWLVLLAIPLFFLVVDDGPRLPRAVAGGALLVFALAYVLAHRNPGLLPVRSPTLRTWLWIGVLVALLALTLPAQGGYVLYSLPFPMALAVFGLPRRHAVAAVAALLAAALLLVALDPAPDLVGALSLLGVLSTLGVLVAFRWFSGRAGREASLRQELALLAEREQVGRDVHDVLGHSLTVISLKAELADRLLVVDPGRARAEVQDVLRLSRESLAEIRRTVARLRTSDLASELAAARTALDAAGVALEQDGDPDDVRPELRALFGWALREGTTNVVRHAGARHVRLAFAEQALRLRDDGVGVGDRVPTGSGLSGLRERVGEAGGTLVLRAPADGGTELEVRMP
ncbi:hypothetical protein DT076_13795 [Desertihabitans brevis]|uniref:Signal transduction histidine kinase subgroup 3 dimerisation and phosphoacceptor domain-containing protein n=1 Tax=Desertihabitans brevis TaxID=2268447 RepID=A0A367YSW4_9ACTN|nr:histidine kinase [Desertihabitans brevis]RCK68976.1 hypothetical protein DT076_13795 [Desertihabitans brevis]